MPAINFDEPLNIDHTLIHRTSTMSAPVSRVVLRRQAQLLFRRNASTTQAAKETASNTANAAKETTQQAAYATKEKAQAAGSKAQEGLSRVASSAGNVASRAGSAIGSIGGRTGRLVGAVNCMSILKMMLAYVVAKTIICYVSRANEISQH